MAYIGLGKPDGRQERCGHLKCHREESTVEVASVAAACRQRRKQRSPSR